MSKDLVLMRQSSLMLTECLLVLFITPKINAHR